MANKTPVFPIPTQPQHFNDYGFDPQIDYFQVLEEARRHKRDNLRCIDALHFKLQKPISKEDSKKNKCKKKKRWWRNALLFWRWKWIQNVGDEVDDLNDDGYIRRNRCAYRGALSGPVYITESRSGSVTPSRCNSRTASGPLAGTSTPRKEGEVDIPYMSLQEFNLEHQKQQMIHQSISNSPMPIYLVT